MILDDAESGALSEWLSGALEPICEAEPTVLAKYVIALLRNDKPDDELKARCEEELEDFLKAHTQKFVSKLSPAQAEIQRTKGLLVLKLPLPPARATRWLCAPAPLH